MTKEEIFGPIWDRVKSNWGRFERLLASSADGALATVEAGWKSFQSYVAIPKHFLWVTLGGILVFDLFTKGSNGVILFIVKSVTDIVHASSTGANAWPIVALAAIIAMFNQKK